MAGLVPAIHGFSALGADKMWMPGTRPGMTIETVFINTLLGIVARPPSFAQKNPCVQKNLPRLSTLKIRVKWRLRI
jgi:hypothetical protein